MSRHRFLPSLLLGASLGAGPAVAVTADAQSSTASSIRKTQSAVPPRPRVTGVLANTQWRLVEFQSMDDSQGTQRPDAPARYVLRLDADGTATMWLNCNRVTGTWLAEPTGKANKVAASGRFEFGHINPRAKPCPSPGMEQNILRQATNVRSFVLKDGRLNLALMADGGIYVWSREGTAAAGAKPATRAATKPVSSPPATQPRETQARPSSAPAAATQTQLWQVTRRVNLREQPSTQSKVLALLPPGTWLSRGDCQAAEGREWCRVSVQSGGEGFVAAEYLQATKPAAR